jgi:hypothetical protein
MRRFRVAAFLSGAIIVAAPGAAQAQSAIAGVVKDASGAVLPGVTVDASSPVLIEKSRSVVSDAQGEYKIVDLRPGLYALTFTLAGFTTVRREGLELPSNFTMSVNAELKVGALEETLTVTGASPIIDVQTNTKAQVLSREVLDAVPTSHTIQSIGQLVVGVTLTAPDVGGSQAMQQTYFSVHGSGAAQTTVTIDGLIANTLQNDGAIQYYYNDGMNQEMSYQTGGGTGEAPTGGVRLNMITKDGGNRFSGSFFGSWEAGSWQSDNLTTGLQAAGVKAVDKIDRISEFDGTEGGPILKDTLWFFAAGRTFTVNKPIANTFYVPAGQNYSACVAGTVACAQGIDDQLINSAMVRMTWQVSPRNKLAAYHDRLHKYRGHAMNPGDDPVTASVLWTSPMYMAENFKWTSTVTSKLLVESGLSINIQRYYNLYQPGIEQPYGSPGWYANARRMDNGFATQSVASAAEVGVWPDRYNIQSALSYVTGSHSLKLGYQHSWGPFNQTAQANADLYQNYTNGAPVSVTVLNTPLRWQDRLNGNVGIYAQDAWTFKRVTINYGARWEHVNQQVTAAPAEVGRFGNVPAHGDIPMPTWTSLSPRTSVVYDLSGTGKTAVRFGFNRFEAAATTGLASLYDPTALTTANISWTDLNHDNIAQGSPGCVYLTPGCELNFAQLPKNFGVLSLASPSPDIKRPYNLAYNLGLQHEVMPGISVSAEWFHDDFKNLMVRNNILRTADSYAPVNIVSPLDGSAITVYNVKPAFVQAVQNVDSTEPNLTQAYNAIEFSIDARLPGGGKIFGGSSTERSISNSCAGAATNPNFLLYCDQARSGIPWRTQFKLVGTYPLPWGIQLSGAFQALPGYLLGTQALTGGFQISNTGLNLPNGAGTVWQITPATRYALNCPGPCTPGALVIPGMTTATLNVPLVAPGTEQTPRITQLDLTIGKWITVGRTRLQPKVDVFNALNSADYFTVRTQVFGGSTYMQPGSVLQGRIVRLGAEVKW